MAGVKKNKSAESKYGFVVTSTRVRIARNLAGRKFPGWANKNELCEIEESLRDDLCCAADDAGIEFEYFPITDETSSFLRNSFLDKRLISPVFFDRQDGIGVGVSADESVNEDFRFSVMVNEEDHLRIQAIVSDYDIEKAFDAVNRFDDALAHYVDYAYDSKLGYLTACPSNAGTGLRVSSELYLPGIMLMGQFDQVRNALAALKFNVRGCGGEDSDIDSCSVQISTGGTLGLSERQVIDSLRKAVDEVVRQELSAREFLIKHRPLLLLDYLIQAFRRMTSSILISSEDAVIDLKAIRLAHELGCLSGLKKKDFDLYANISRNSFFERFLPDIGIALPESDNEKLSKIWGPAVEKRDLVDAYRARQLNQFLSKCEVKNFKKGLQ